MQSKGDDQTWNILLERYMAESNAQEKKKMLKGLAWTDQPWILNQFLRLAKNETIVRGQDYFICLRYIAFNPIGKLAPALSLQVLTQDVIFSGKPLVWQFIREEWPYLVERFSLNDRYLGRMPKYISAGFSTEFRLQELKDFFAKYPDAGAGNYSMKC